MRRLLMIACLVTAGGLVGLGCGEAAEGTSARGESPGAGGADGVDGTDGADGVDGTDGFIPEEEQDLDLQAPQGGERFVFVVSTGLDAVVRIDGVDLGVDLIEVGGEPTVMRTLSGEDALLVYNRGTEDFSVVRFGEAETPDVTTVDAGVRLNRLEVSESGRWAVAFFDATIALPWEPLGDLQLVLVLELAAGAESVTHVGVGFAPEAVTFDAAEETAFVVTESGVSVIALTDLAGATFAPEVPLGQIDPEAPDREVLITPSGGHAVVRIGGESFLRVVPLDGSGAVEVALPGAPTDVDLAAGGAEALALVRDEQVLVRVPLDDPAGAEEIALPDTPAGVITLSDDGTRALLHTTLEAQEWIAVLDLETGALSRHALKKGVAAVALSPDGAKALVLHDRLAAPVTQEDDLETRIDKSWAYSVLDVASGFVKLVLLDSAPTSFMVTPDSAHAYVLVPDETGADHTADDIDLASLQVTTHPLGSPPEHLVYVPAATRVAVSQDHPVGRITFISTTTGTTETVTGFELNGLIH